MNREELAAKIQAITNGWGAGPAGKTGVYLAEEEWAEVVSALREAGRLREALRTISEAENSALDLAYCKGGRSHRIQGGSMSQSDTPRVDALMEKYVGEDHFKLTVLYGVMHDFARTLERESAAQLKQIARMDKDLDLLRERLAEARRDAVEGWACAVDYPNLTDERASEIQDRFAAARAKEEGNGRLAD